MHLLIDQVEPPVHFLFWEVPPESRKPLNREAASAFAQLAPGGVHEAKGKMILRASHAVRQVHHGMPPVRWHVDDLSGSLDAL